MSELILKTFPSYNKNCIFIYDRKYHNIIIVHIKVKLYERKWPTEYSEN